MKRFFPPRLDPLGRGLYLIYGGSAEIKRCLRSLPTNVCWDPETSGMHWVITRPRGDGTYQQHIVVVARTNRREEELTLLHELTHMVDKALWHCGISGNSRGVREFYCHYLEWQYGRCLAALKAAR